MLKCFLLIVTLIPTLVFAASQPARPTNWAETLKDALELNTKPREKDAELAAQGELTRSAKHAYYPTIGLNAGVSNSNSRSNSTSSYKGSSTTSNSSSGSWGQNVNASLYWTVFQCGVRYYALQMAKINEEAMREQFNSTQFEIHNSKGALVINAFNSYKDLLYSNEQLTIYPRVKEYLALLEPIAAQDADAAASLANTKAQYLSSEVSTTQEKESAVELFIHWVTLPPSDRINTSEQAMNELQIPANEDEAFAIAQKQSPDIKQAVDQIRIAEYQIKIAQAEFCPRVSLVASVGYDWNQGSSRSSGDSSSYDSQSGSFSAYGGLSVSMPIFDLPARDRIEYQKKMLIAAKLSQQAEMEDARFSLHQSYVRLANHTKYLEIQQGILDALERTIQKTEDDIAHHQNLPDPKTSGAVSSYISVKLQAIGSYQGAQFNVAYGRSRVIDDKFAIQQAMGTPFADMLTSQTQVRNPRH